MTIIVYSTFPPAYLAYLAVGLLTDKRDKRDVLSFHLLYIIGYGKIYPHILHLPHPVMEDMSHTKVLEV